MKKLEDIILTYKDFPKKGIDFKDVYLKNKTFLNEPFDNIFFSIKP